MAVIVYSSGCPKCKILKSKMDDKNIDFKLIEDVEVMKSKGFEHAPMLEVNEKIYDFNQAIKFVNKFDGSDFESFVTSMQ